MVLDKQGYMHTHACTHTHTHKYVICIAFPWQQQFTNAPQCYIIRTLPVFLQFVKNIKMLGSYKCLNILHLLIYSDIWPDTDGRWREFGTHLSRNDSSSSCKCYLHYISHYRLVMNGELQECGWKLFLHISGSTVSSICVTLHLLWKKLHHQKLGVCCI
jgi:hypothetical protein